MILNLNSTDLIIEEGKPVKKSKLPMTVTTFAGFPVQVEGSYYYYIIYELNDELAYRQVSEEEYNNAEL